MKRILAGALGLALAGLMNLSLYSQTAPRAVQAEVPSTYDPNISMRVRYDYDDNVRQGVVVPAFVEVDNKGSAVEGILRLSITPRGSKEAVAYEMDIYVGENSKSSFTLPFWTRNETNNIKVHLLRNGKAIAEAKTAYGYITSSSALLAGVLSSNIYGSGSGASGWDRLRYLQNDSATAISVSPVELTADTFPEEIYLLDRFALIVLSHYDIGLLSETQQEVLTHWVNRGGRLLVDNDGTNTAAMRSLRSVLGLSGEGRPAEISSPSYVLGETALKDQIQQYAVGNGKVFTTDFALDDSSLLFVGVADIFGMVRGLAGDGFYLEGVDYGYYSYSSSYSLDGAVKSIKWLDAPSIAWILVMLLAFIIIAGPIGYVILAKRDKRDFIWVAAPLLSLLCCAIIISYGIARHGTQTVSSVVTVADTRPDTKWQPYSLVGVAAPRKNSYDIRYEEQGAFPFLPSYSYSYYSYEEDPPAGEPAILFDMGGKQRVNFPNIEQWNMSTFYLQRDISLGDGLQANIRYMDGGVAYTVRNNTGADLEDVTLVTLQGYIRIPLMEAGEENSGELQEYVTPQSAAYGGSYYSGSYFGSSNLDYWTLIRELYGSRPDEDSVFRRDTRSEDEQREDYLRSTIIYALANNSSVQALGAADGAALWAWSQEIGVLPMEANGKAVKNHLNRAVVIGGVASSYGDNGEVVIPLGYIPGIVVDSSLGYGNGDYYAYFSDGEVVFSFDLPADFASGYRMDRLLITASSSYGTFRALLYNKQTGDWDEYRLDDELTGDKVDDYIDNGTVWLKITSDLGNDPDDPGADTYDPYGGDISIDYPTISVSGKAVS